MDLFKVSRIESKIYEYSLPRVFIIFGVFFFSLLLAPRFATRKSLLDLFPVLLLGIVVAAILLLRSPGLGLPLMIGVALTIPIGVMSLNAAILFMSFLVGLWLFDMFVLQRKIWLAPSKTILSGIIFIIVVLFSFGFGQLSWFLASPAPLIAQLGQLAVFVLSIFAYLLVMHQANERWLRRMTWVYLGLGGLYILRRLFISLGYSLRSMFIEEATGSVFWIWLGVMAFSMAILNKKLAVYLRLILAALFIATLYVGVVIAREWASGWIPVLVAVGVTVFVAYPRRGIVLLTIMLLVFVLFQVSVSVTSSVVIENEYSIYTRL